MYQFFKKIRNLWFLFGILSIASVINVINYSSGMLLPKTHSSHINFISNVNNTSESLFP